MESAGLSARYGGAPRPGPAAELRLVAGLYGQVQRMRVQTGERIRAVLQGRSRAGEAVGAGPGSAATSADELRSIRSGHSRGPVPALGETYRRLWEEERALIGALSDLLLEHPAWPWLERVRGVGPSLAGRLLGRLDAHRADTPSGFWAYCGLATVPGVEYSCAECGLRLARPVGTALSGRHSRLRGRGTCSGTLVPARGADAGVRVAQPRPRRGQRGTYDPEAKRVCYLIGASFLKTGGKYEAHYRREREKLDAQRPGWATGRKHLTALRKTEKLFLSHLWLVWRQAEGLPTTRPYAPAGAAPEQWIDPWTMVEETTRDGNDGIIALT